MLGDVKRLSVLGCPYNGWNFTGGNIWTVGILTNGVNCPVANVLGRSPVLQNLLIVVHQLPQMHQIFIFHYKEIFLVENFFLFFIMVYSIPLSIFLPTIHVTVSLQAEMDKESFRNFSIILEMN